MTKKKALVIISAALIVGGGLMACIGYLLGGYSPLLIGREGISLESQIEQTEIDRELAAFKSMDIDIDLATVTLVAGSEYRVRASYGSETKSLNVDVQGDTLVINEEGANQVGIRFFDMGYDDWQHSRSIEIEYPAGTKFDSIDIDNDAGDFNAKEISASALNVDIDMGSVTIDSASVDAATVSVDGGDFTAENFESNSFDGDVTIGEITINGILRGSTNISVEAGDLNIDMKAQAKYFNYQIDDELGDTWVDGEDFRGTMMNNKTDNVLTIINEMGNIDISFQK